MTVLWESTLSQAGFRKIVIEEVDSMRRSIFLALFFLSAGCLLAAAQQQNSSTTLRGELRKLLSLSAPTPRVAALR